MLENSPISKCLLDVPLYYLAGSQTSNLNNSANLKPILETFYVTSRRPIWGWLINKNRGKQNLATLSLSIEHISLTCILRYKSSNLRSGFHRHGLRQLYLCLIILYVHTHKRQSVSSSDKNGHSNLNCFGSTW